MHFYCCHRFAHEVPIARERPWIKLQLFKLVQNTIPQRTSEYLHLSSHSVMTPIKVGSPPSIRNQVQNLTDLGSRYRCLTAYWLDWRAIQLVNAANAIPQRNLTRGCWQRYPVGIFHSWSGTDCQSMRHYKAGKLLWFPENLLCEYAERYWPCIRPFTLPTST